MEITPKEVASFQYVKRLRILHPFDQFLAGNKINIGQGQNGVNKFEKGFSTMRSVEEPSGMEKQREWCLVFGITIQKVLGKYLLD